MSIVHLRHITTFLDKTYGALIDQTDIRTRNEEQKREAFHSRAQAAFALRIIAKIDDATSSSVVTDGYRDNGIDAIYYDTDGSVLHIVQSKWHKAGNGTIDNSEVAKFVQGVNDLLSGEFSRFNDKLNKLSKTITFALDNERLKINLILVHTGTHTLSPSARVPLDDLLKELNDASPIAKTTIVTQKQLHEALASAIDNNSVNLEIALEQFGYLKQPYASYYGSVAASDVGSWFLKEKEALFAKNLRQFTGSTEVNQAIKATLRECPEKFWYHNNGITILCDGLKKKPVGGSKKAFGVFTCTGVSVVNGAQTVGCIGEIAATSPELLENARVQVRLISLANCPNEFATEITRSANTQNRIARRDFAALDPEQDRLRQELQIELGKTYNYKSGANQGAPADSCNIEEATIALACANADAGLAVQAKREVGKLWEDIEKAPYKLLFNPSLTALKMWRAVEILRAVDAALHDRRSDRSGPPRTIAVHGNRIILHHVFQAIGVNSLDDARTDFEKLKSLAMTTAGELLEHLETVIQKDYQGVYLNCLFKNAAKCKVLSEKLQKMTLRKTGTGVGCKRQ